MPAGRLSVRKIREILRLRWDQRLSYGEIAQSCSIGRTTVCDYVRRATEAGLSWPLRQELDDGKLEELLFAEVGKELGRKETAPDWAQIDRELRRKGVTLMLLWHEYKASNPSGYQYTQFCTLYRKWSKELKPYMRQRHKAGERVFLDYAGQTIGVMDPGNGVVRDAYLFLAVLGASNYTYGEASFSQSLPDWIGSHVRAFEFFGGVPDIACPDNLKSGVKSPCRYEPEINATYRDLAEHYNISVIPARSRKPRDKAKVEAGVLIAERWILATLRNRRFFSLAELNAAIREKLKELNERPMQKLKESRLSLFEKIERGALKPLPATAYEYAEWKRHTLGQDYHVEVDEHFYSIPHRHIGKKLDVRVSAKTVECFFKGNRVASHPRSDLKGEQSTLREHMPESHRRYVEWTPERIRDEAGAMGEDVAALVDAVMKNGLNPKIGARSCLGILRLGKEYGLERLGAACRKALAIGALSYRSLRSMLQCGLDRVPIESNAGHCSPLPEHENVRGPQYFH